MVSPVSLISFVIITLLFSIKDKTAKEVRFRFGFTTVVYLLLTYLFKRYM